MPAENGKTRLATSSGRSLVKAPSTMRIMRGWQARTSRAPAACKALAMYQAKLRSLPTPVTRAVLPLKSMGIMAVARSRGNPGRRERLAESGGRRKTGRRGGRYRICSLFQAPRPTANPHMRNAMLQLVAEGSKLNVQFDAHEFTLSEAERSKMVANLESLGRHAACFPVADLHVYLEF